MSSQPFFHHLIGYRTLAAQCGHRVLVLISGSERYCQQQFSTLFTALCASHTPPSPKRVPLLLGDDALCGISPSDKKHFLGSESDLLLINAWQHIDFNEWLAAIDTLVAGGLWVLLCPDLHEWPGYYHNRITAQSGCQDHQANFVRRLTRSLANDANAFILSEREGLSFPAVNETFSSGWKQSLPTEEQLSTVDAIKRCALGRAWRPLLIRADRGRGKSSALGLAAADLIRQGKSVIITALHRDAVAAAFQRVEEVLGGGVKLSHQGQGSLRYLSPEQLLDESLNPDLLMVDEAAMLSVSLLASLLDRYPRIVFSSTVFGYEGSGRGFDIRFRAILDAKCPQWRRSYLRQPIRWSESDPLEHALSALFLLNTGGGSEEGAVVKTDIANQATAIDIIHLSGWELQADEALLAQVFELLVQAHYQTSPQDLVRLMDMPQHLVLAVQDGQVLGVCQCFPEGGVTCHSEQPGFLDKCISGERRPRGNLVAQRLANRYAEPAFLVSKSLRVSRITVSACHRRRGIGGMLLASLCKKAEQTRAFISSSFAVEPGVLQFWQRQGFRAMYLGNRRDASSGSYSVIVLKALKVENETLFAPLFSLFQSNLPLQVATGYSGLSGASLARLFSENTADLDLAASLEDAFEARRYAQGELSFAQARPVLWRMSKQAVCQQLEGWWWVLELLVLNRDESALQTKLGYSGYAELQRELRTFFATLTDVIWREAGQKRH